MFVDHRYEATLPSAPRKAPFLYLCQDAVDRPLVHFAGDGVLPESRGDGAQVVEGGHPQGHLRLLVAELVHLKPRRREGGGPHVSTHSHPKPLDRRNLWLRSFQSSMLGKTAGEAGNISLISFVL